MIDGIPAKCDCHGTEILGQWRGNVLVIKHGPHMMVITAQAFLKPISDLPIELGTKLLDTTTLRSDYNTSP